MNRTVTAVTEDGSPVREVDILDAHTKPGILHRAFSVFIFSPDASKLLLQQRHAKKPTFGGQWGNTCCSHQYAGEDDVTAGMRRLQEEMGFSVPLSKKTSFVYQANDPRGNGMAEHEHDTILIGTAEESTLVTPNPQEVDAWKWMSVHALKIDFHENPDLYVPWLSLALQHCT